MTGTAAAFAWARRCGVHQHTRQTLRRSCSSSLTPLLLVSPSSSSSSSSHGRLHLLAAAHATIHVIGPRTKKFCNSSSCRCSTATATTTPPHTITRSPRSSVVSRPKQSRLFTTAATTMTTHTAEAAALTASTPSVLARCMQMEELGVLQSLFPPHSGAELAVITPNVVNRIAAWLQHTAAKAALAPPLPSSSSSSSKLTTINQEEENMLDTDWRNLTVEKHIANRIAQFNEPIVIAVTLAIPPSRQNDKDTHQEEEETEQQQQQPLEITLQLTWPPQYPFVNAKASITCSSLSHVFTRQLADLVNTQLLQDDVLVGEPQTFEAVQYLTEHAWQTIKQVQQAGNVNHHQPDARAAAVATAASTSTANRNRKTNAVLQFQRTFIHFHHIYAQSKRKAIVAEALELELTGMSVPGKPGLVVIEGESANVEEWLARIRRLVWKKMTVRDRFEVNTGIDSLQQLDMLRKFANTKFAEFVTRTGARSNHPDMALVLERMRQVGLEQKARYALGFDSNNGHCAMDNAVVDMEKKNSGTKRDSTESRIQDAVSTSGEAVLITTRVKPNSASSSLTGVTGTELGVRLAAHPRDGSANDELVRFMAQDVLQVKRNQVTVARGHKARSKVISVKGDMTGTSLSRQAVCDAIARHMDPIR